MECLGKQNYQQTYRQIYNQIKSNWDSIAKPLDSLGKLECIISKIGAVQGTVHPQVDKSAVLILCSDNGIVEEKVSQSDQSVTAICAENIAGGKTTVGIMAEQSGTELLTVDLGIARADNLPDVINKKIRYGTRNFIKEPAMSRDEVLKAIETGKELVRECKRKGFNILCIGEMGIGNTTTSAAIAASLFKCSAELVTGRGAGLNDAGLERKISVINEAVAKYNLFNVDVLSVLQTVGGYDIAGMVGVYIASKECKLPIVLDGAISMVAALVAERLEPGTKDFLIPSHKSREPLVVKVMQELELDPVIDGNMALGEGTGAVLFMQIIKTAAAVYEKSVPFAESGVEQYKRY